MSRDIKRPAPKGTKAGPSGRDAPLPQFIPPQLSQPVEKPPSGSQWVHEIKLDGFRMAARVDNGRVQLLTRTGLDWTPKYPGAIAALETLKGKSVHLVYYAFDLLHLAGCDVSNLQLIERKALLEPLVANKAGIQFNGHDTGD